MHFITLKYDGRSYNYHGGTSPEMDVIGCFLASDVEWNWLAYRQWFFTDPNLSASGHLTSLHKEKVTDEVLISDLFPLNEKMEPVTLRMSSRQFIQLLDDWQEKVERNKPQEIIVKYENNEFTIETK